MQLISYSERLINGILQKFYQSETYEIIVSILPPKAKLDKHNHDACQFGTTFGKEFIFGIEENNYTISPGIVYDLTGNVAHSGVNEGDENVTSLDIKYLLPTKGGRNFPSNETINLKSDKMSEHSYKQYFANNKFIFEKYVLDQMGNLTLRNNIYDFIIPVSVTVAAGLKNPLVLYGLYRLEPGKEYEISSAVGGTSFILLKFKD